MPAAESPNYRTRVSAASNGWSGAGRPAIERPSGGSYRVIGIPFGSFVEDHRLRCYTARGDHLPGRYPLTGPVPVFASTFFFDLRATGFLDPADGPQFSTEEHYG